MRRKILFVIWLTVLHIFLAADYQKKHQGRFVSRYLDQQARPQTIPLCSQDRSSYHLSCIKNDLYGQPWIVQKTRGVSGWNIQLGKIQDGKIKGRISVSQDVGGNNMSPDLEFTSGNQPWAAWVNQYHGFWRLYVQNTSTSQTWEVTSAKRPLFTPDIIADKTGRVWVFWTGVQSGYDQIFVSYLEYGTWSRPETLTPDSSVPHFHPAVTLNEFGYPLAVWSSFTRTGYRLYSSY